jgi:hypothetical protein
MIHDFQLQASELREFQRTFIISPIQWAGYVPVVVTDWNLVHFEAGKVDDVPNGACGVYTFLVQPRIANHDHCSYLLYVGRTTEQDFRERFRQYLGEKASKKPRRPHITDMLNRWDGYLWFCYAQIQNPNDTKQTEKRLQVAFIPPFNREFPADIRAAVSVLR